MIIEVEKNLKIYGGEFSSLTESELMAGAILTPNSSYDIFVIYASDLSDCILLVERDLNIENDRLQIMKIKNSIAELENIKETAEKEKIERIFFIL